MRGCGTVINFLVGVPKFQELGHCHDRIPGVYFDCALFLDCANTVVCATVLLLDLQFFQPATDVVSALVFDFYGQIFDAVYVAAVI